MVDTAGSRPRADLVILAADRSIELVLAALVDRPDDLGIRPIEVRTLAHPRRDPGCLRESQDLLRSQAMMASFALVVFDREGCGRDAAAPEAVEREVVSRLEANGWEGRAAAVVVDPELEVWAWTRSAALTRRLGWNGRESELEKALLDAGFLRQGDHKPHRPKKALELALRATGKPRSSALLQELARTLPTTPCEDLSFRRLCAVLRAWFPVVPESRLPASARSQPAR